MSNSDFVQQVNADYIEQLYQQFLNDPTSVDDNWRLFFSGFEVGAKRDAQQPAAMTPVSYKGPNSEIGIYDLVHSYRELGHFLSNLDPLGNPRKPQPLLDLKNFGISPADMDRRVNGGGFVGFTEGTVGELVERLRACYCGTIGVEFTDIFDKTQRDWLIQRMEPILNKPRFSDAEKKSILFQLVAAEEFEQFLHTRYVGTKRFSLEGGEALIPLINQVVEEGARLGGEATVMGMAHRGRLNVLAHVLNKPYEVLLGEFEGTNVMPENVGGDGDVKYHLGFANTRPLGNGHSAKVSLVPNPSHLELINPIMQGIIRCKQRLDDDKSRTHIVPLVIHGEAAFVGQGIVSETLSLSELPGWRTGGSIHVIINNQIGFTTLPQQARFTPYPTDLAKAIQAPIFHVNGDDPEAVVWAAKLAIGFRQEFKCDVLIDLWCYRRHGHNETDEPTFTQPVMYRQIENHKTTREVYEQKLIAEGVISAEDAATMKKTVIDRLEKARTMAKEVRPRMKVPHFSGVWKGFGRAGDDWTATTRVDRALLDRIADVGTTVPADFTVHPKLQKMLQARRESVKNGKGIDWGTGEMLALGSLLSEGTHIRFTGQDAQRGTFSHRHAVLHDFNNGSTCIPLRQLVKEPWEFAIMNTMLSELAVLGFEWGFSSADPHNLVIWEAQFGDFVNGAQAIIDQIIASAESKWLYMNGLVMLLPHGYEGAGPEHSNAYIERFLSLCAEGNIQVCIPSTPAQYFHFLRRQIRRKFRKPLIMMMPKYLLRYEPSSSKIEDFTHADSQLVIDDANVSHPENIRRVVLCTGKVYYTLAAARAKNKVEDVALIRVEQLYPYPKTEIAALLNKYRVAKDVAWAQEEPRNRGAWSFMESRLRELLVSDQKLRYIGRKEAASPAAGNMKSHNAEEADLVADALDLGGKAKAAAPAPATTGDKKPVPSAK